VSNKGQFPELTPVCRQTTEAWLPTPGASDIVMLVISGTDDQWWPARSVETTPESAQATKSVAGID